jgi:DNA-binding SARP family transcriptional activator
MTASITLFDSMRLSVDGTPLDVRSDKLKMLLAYLILNRGRSIDRAAVGDALWPSADDSTARRNLREYLYRLRTFLTEDWPVDMHLTTDGTTITFDPTDAVWIDVRAFERHLDAAENASLAEKRRLLAEAVDIYRGDLLAAFWEDWIAEWRDYLHERYHAALLTLCRAHHHAGDLPAAVGVAHQALAVDPLDEAVHRRLMRLYYEGGDRTRALEQYRQCRQLLSDELAARPMPETRQLYQHMLDGTYTPPRDTLSPPPPRRTERPQTPFVGRGADLARLQEMFALAQQGQRLALVTGASGLGKTRLVSEWLSALPPDTLILRGRSHEFEQTIPYQPLLDALQQALHLIPWEALPAAETASWLAPLAHLLPDLYYYMPELATADNPLDTEAGHYIQEAFSQLLLSFTRQFAVVLFLDDLHWADSATWGFLAFLVRRAGEVPLFLVATFTTSEASEAARARLLSLERRSEVGVLTLQRLTRAELAELVAQRFAAVDEASGQAEALAERLAELTGGNPFFATEILQALLESESTPPYTPADLDRLSIPQAVQLLIESRLDRLPPESRRALSIAATFGREFTLPLLAHAADLSEDALLDHIDEWLARGLIEDRLDLLDFTHQQVREVAYARLSGPRRRRAHNRVAEALTAANAEHERITTHYQMSHQPQRAIPGLLEAGRRALNARAYGQAKQIGQQLLAILREVPAADDNRDHLIQMALAYSFTRQTGEALDMLNRAEALTTSADQQAAEVALRLAQLHWVRSEAPAARRYAERAHTLDEEGVYRLPILRLLGRIAVSQGRFAEAITHLEPSLELDVGDLNEANTQGYLATAYGHLGQQPKAEKAIDRALTIAQRLESPALLAVAQIKAGVATCYLAQWAAARRYTEAGLALCEELGLGVYTFVGISIVGRVTFYEGDTSAAVATLQQAIHHAGSGDYLLFQHLPHLFLAEIAAAEGDAAALHKQAVIVRQLAEKTGNVWSTARIADYLASVDAPPTLH